MMSFEKIVVLYFLVIFDEVMLPYSNKCPFEGDRSKDTESSSFVMNNGKIVPYSCSATHACPSCCECCDLGPLVTVVPQSFSRLGADSLPILGSGLTRKSRFGWWHYDDRKTCFVA